MLRRLLLFVVACILVFQQIHISFAEEYPELSLQDLEAENMINLNIQYIGILNNALEGTPVTTSKQFTKIVSGRLPLYGFYDGYAYFPYFNNIYQLPIEKFTNIEPIGNEIIAACKTSYTDSSGEYTNNILLASELINDFIIEPEATFDFISITGPYSEENGYKPTYITDEKILYTEYGAGVDQVASTIYASIINNPNIEVTKREPHSQSIGEFYLPKDMDASVFKGKEFQFINHYPFAIKVEIEYEFYSKDATHSILVLIKRV